MSAHIHTRRGDVSRPAGSTMVVAALIASVSVLVSAEHVRAKPQAAGNPNIVIILADDMGYGDASCYGNIRYKTPHIDKLAAGGLRFTDFHSNGAVCSPTRAALLTGRYQQRAGIPGVVYADPKRVQHYQGLQDVELTFAESMAKAGYATAIMGKWHLGYHKPYNPVRHGFNLFRGYVSGNVDFQSHIDGAGKFDWWHNDKLDRDDKGYTTHLITKHAVSFIEAHKDQPFVLYIAHEAPHYPYQGPNDPPLRVEGKSGQRGGLWNDRAPKHVPKAYREMMVEMDKGVGDVVAALERAGIADNTLVFFFSDNGATRDGSNGVLRGTKGSLWEGGHRVPAIAYWPGRIKAGMTTDQLAIGMDLMPTMLDLAGVAPPTQRPLDGVSLKPVLLEGKQLGNRKLFWQHGANTAMRDGQWKLIRTAKGKPQLFDLSNDLSEKTDLSGKQNKRANGMLREIRTWENDVHVNATPQPTKEP